MASLVVPHLVFSSNLSVWVLIPLRHCCEVCLSSPTAITSQSSAHPPPPSSSNPSGYVDVTCPPPATKCLLLGICPIRDYTFEDLVSMSIMKNFDMALLSPSGSSPPLPVFSLPHPHVSSPHVLNNDIPAGLWFLSTNSNTQKPKSINFYNLFLGVYLFKSFVYYCVGEGMCAMVHSQRPETNSQVSPSTYSIHFQEGDRGCQT